jgi:hypothetical protein
MSDDRLGFSPTFVIETSDPVMAAAATAQNAAEEISPGIVREQPVSRWPPLSAICRPSIVTRAPNATSARSV